MTDIPTDTRHIVEMQYDKYGTGEFQAWFNGTPLCDECTGYDVSGSGRIPEIWNDVGLMWKSGADTGENVRVYMDNFKVSTEGRIGQ